MITKDQLKQLEQQQREARPQIDYTIDGGMETVVHQQVERDRQRQIANGKEQLQHASNELRQTLSRKFADGLLRSRFQSANNQVPDSDRAIAESTWRQNHIDSHKQQLEQARTRLRDNWKTHSTQKTLTPGERHHER